MDEKIRRILSEKLDDSLKQNNDIEKIISCFKQKLDVNSLHTGILVGRLYNSFYYQHRRILKRNPSEDEFNEFVDFINVNIKEYLKLFSK